MMARFVYRNVEQEYDQSLYSYTYMLVVNQQEQEAKINLIALEVTNEHNILKFCGIRPI